MTPVPLRVNDGRMWITAAVALLGLGVVSWPLWVLSRDLRDIRDHRERSQAAFLGVAQSIADTMGDAPFDRIESVESRQADLLAQVVELASKVDVLPHTWEEMYHKVRRTEERTRGAVKRARSQLQAAGLDPDEELEGTWASLQPGDGAGSPGSGVPTVPEGMGPIPSNTSQGAEAPSFRQLGLLRKYGNA